MVAVGVNKFYKKRLINMISRENKRIKPEEISIVVQGPIMPYTANCLAGTRRVLPDSEIVLSTWKDSDVSGLDYDKVVFSDDPGGDKLFLENDQLLNNVNRQIISAYSGIKAATRKYVIKMRTDFEIVSDGFLSCFENNDYTSNVLLGKENCMKAKLKKGLAFLIVLAFLLQTALFSPSPSVTALAETGEETVSVETLAEVTDAEVELDAYEEATEGTKAAGKTVLAFSSDVHNTSGNSSANRMAGWITNVEAKEGTSIDAMAFGGDMAGAGASNYWTHA